MKNDSLTVVFCAYDWIENNSGPSTWLAHLLPRLKKHHITPTVILFYWDCPGPLYRALTAANIPVKLAPCDGFTENRVRFVLDCIAETQPDVFVPNLVTPAFLASQYIRAWNIPTVGVLHSDDRFYRAVADRFVYGRPVDSLSAVVCVSQQIESEILCKPSKYTTPCRIPYGIDVPAPFDPKPASPFRIAYVGRLAEEQKRISDVVKALCLVTNQIPNTEAVLIGDGPDRHVAERLVQSLSANGKVKLAGRIENSEIAATLQQFDAITLLSDYEGLPIALLEGMACGVVPIVTEMKSGIPELIEHNVNGLIAKDRYSGVLDEVYRLVQDPGLKQRLAAAAQNTIRQKFTLEQNANLWAKLLVQLSQKSHSTKKKNRIPLKFNFPPVHPDLEKEDPRKPVKSRYTRARILLGRLRSAFFKRPPRP